MSERSNTRDRNYNPEDESPIQDGDSLFIGVDEQRDPSLLKPGYVSSATNKRFRLGVAEDRDGIQICPWMRGANGATPFDTTTYPVCGGGVFSDPLASDLNAAEWMLVAAEGKVWATRPNLVAFEVPLPAGVVIDDDVEFSQMFGNVLMGRGFGKAALEMTNLSEGFHAITQQTSDAGSGTATQPIPNFSYAEFVQNRAVLVGDGDLGWVSDIGNYTRCQVGNAYRINTGNASRLQRIVKFSDIDKSVVVFKDQSIFLISNLTPNAAGDWTAAVGPNTITEAYGLAAPRAVVNTGSDIFFLSHKGIMSIRQSEYNAIQVRNIPLSARMEQTMKRVNWQYASGAVFGFDPKSNKLFCALPLDDARVYGDNQVIAGDSYDVSGDYTFSTVVGRKYQVTLGDNDSRVSGVETVTGISEEFVATGATTTLIGTAEAEVTAVIRAVRYEGVNNAVLVYDFNGVVDPMYDLPGQWQGVDTFRNMAVKRWLRMVYQGEQRLFYLGADGIIYLYEEGQEDEVITDGQSAPVTAPYVDVIMKQRVQVGLGTLQINGGTIVISFGGDTLNQVEDPASWGSRSDVAGQNLYADAGNAGGFSRGAVDFWTAPGTGVSQIDGGVRFVNSDWVPGTVGVPVAVSVSGVAETVSGVYGCFFLDFHSGVEIAPWPIASAWTTRGYTGSQQIIDPLRQARKRWAQLKIDLETVDPKVSVVAFTDGADEVVTVLDSLTKDRTQYYTFNVPAWAVTNDSDSHGTAGRQDYSVYLDRDGAGTTMDPTGVVLDETQEAEEGIRTTQARGRMVQFTITNEQGRCAVQNITVEGTVIDRRLLTAA